jgi:hypothetical protein
VPGAARPIGRGEARAHLLDRLLQSVGAATVAKASSLFGWRADDTRKAADRLASAGRLRRADTVAGETGEWLVTADL